MKSIGISAALPVAMMSLSLIASGPASVIGFVHSNIRSVRALTRVSAAPKAPDIPELNEMALKRVSASKFSPGLPDFDDIPKKIALPDIDLSKVALPDIDLSKVDLPDIDLSKIDLPDIDLSKVALPDIDLSKVDLPDIDLSKIDLPDIDLSKVDLPDVDLSKIDLPDIDLSTIGESLKLSLDYLDLPDLGPDAIAAALGIESSTLGSAAAASSVLAVIAGAVKASNKRKKKEREARLAREAREKSVLGRADLALTKIGESISPGFSNAIELLADQFAAVDLPKVSVSIEPLAEEFFARIRPTLDRIRASIDTDALKSLVSRTSETLLGDFKSNVEEYLAVKEQRSNVIGLASGLGILGLVSASRAGKNETPVKSEKKPAKAKPSPEPAEKPESVPKPVRKEDAKVNPDSQPKSETESLPVPAESLPVPAIVPPASEPGEGLSPVIDGIAAFPRNVKNMYESGDVGGAALAAGAPFLALGALRATLVNSKEDREKAQLAEKKLEAEASDDVSVLSEERKAAIRETMEDIEGTIAEVKKMLEEF